MKEDFKEMFQLKNLLWNERFRKLRTKVSCPWILSNLEKMSRSLKNNETRDPNGMINELFKKNIMGKDLQAAVINLMKGGKNDV